ncbi:hypothetical protein NXV13_10455 [Bacteroides ovatus]|nr:hypothetical protein [Bacteroides ovatus]
MTLPTSKLHGGSDKDRRTADGREGGGSGRCGFQVPKALTDYPRASARF